MLTAARRSYAFYNRTNELSADISFSLDRHCADGFRTSKWHYAPTPHSLRTLSSDCEDAGSLLWYGEIVKYLVWSMLRFCGDSFIWSTTQKMTESQVILFAACMNMDRSLAVDDVTCSARRESPTYLWAQVLDSLLFSIPDTILAYLGLNLFRIWNNSFMGRFWHRGNEPIANDRVCSSNEPC